MCMWNGRESFQKKRKPFFNHYATKTRTNLVRNFASLHCARFTWNGFRKIRNVIKTDGKRICVCFSAVRSLSPAWPPLLGLVNIFLIAIYWTIIYARPLQRFILFFFFTRFPSCPYRLFLCDNGAHINHESRDRKATARSVPSDRTEGNRGKWFVWRDRVLKTVGY
jgi:hypothetical protein